MPSKQKTKSTQSKKPAASHRKLIVTVAVGFGLYHLALIGYSLLNLGHLGGLLH